MDDNNVKLDWVAIITLLGLLAFFGSMYLTLDAEREKNSHIEYKQEARS